MRGWQRGSTIVVALLMCAVLATIAVSLLGRRVAQRGVVNAKFVVAQAEALAWAGLEDARVKLMKSRDFPPNTTFAGTQFSYSDTLLDAGGALLGTYYVEVDLRNKNKAIVSSSAQLDGQTSPSLMLRAELDTEQVRKSYDFDGNQGTENRAFLWMRVERFDGQAPR